MTQTLKSQLYWWTPFQRGALHLGSKEDMYKILTFTQTEILQQGANRMFNSPKSLFHASNTLHILKDLTKTEISLWYFTLPQIQELMILRAVLKSVKCLPEILFLTEVSVVLWCIPDFKQILQQEPLGKSQYFRWANRRNYSTHSWKIQTCLKATRRDYDRKYSVIWHTEVSINWTSPVCGIVLYKDRILRVTYLWWQWGGTFWSGVQEPFHKER